MVTAAERGVYGALRKPRFLWEFSVHWLYITDGLEIRHSSVIYIGDEVADNM